MCNLNEVIAKSIELNNAIKKMNEDLKIVKYEQNGNWSMIVFEKK